MFPAPLEVDRELYSSLLVICTMTSFCFRPLSRQIGSYTKLERKGLRFRKQGFPSPLEVDRCSSNHTDHINKDRKFPAPLEVDRYLYIKSEVGALCYNLKRFRPLSRQIGIYTPYLVCKPITSTRYNLLKTTISIPYFVRVFISKEQTILLFYLDFICI